MDDDIQRLLADAMKLPVAARAALADSLLQTLDEAVDDGVQEAWDAEIARRLQAVRNGTAVTMPWSEARKLIERSIRGAR